MSVDKVRKLCNAQPFQPFVIHLREGRSVPVYNRELIMITPFLGHLMQNGQWTATLRNLAAHWGVQPSVEAQVVCLDRGRRWSQAKNIWQNAGINSAIHAIGAPIRRIARR